MLAFGDTRSGNVDGYLTAIQGMYQLGKATPVIHIHLQIENGFFLGKIA